MHADRSLQDRMVQGFAGLLFLMQAARNVLPDSAERAIAVLDDALEEGDRSLREYVVAMERLHLDDHDRDDMVGCIAALGREIGKENERRSIEYRVVQEGLQRTVRPLLRDEVYRVVRTAVLHAVHFAAPSLVEVELDFSNRRLRVCVRDDGVGIAATDGRPQSDVQERLSAMQDGVRGFGGQFRVWSRRAAGTEIELTFSARQAYLHKSAGPRHWIRHVAASSWKT
jgi:signal transduction histidine kinase